VRPNGTTSAGCQLDCQCNVLTVPCNCSGSNCLCNTCDGTCFHDSVCDIVSTTPPAGTTCSPCPVGSDGQVCSGNGVCGCGTCLCSTTIENAAGPACDTPTNGGQFNTCVTCTLNQFTWCNLGGVYSCMSYDSCVTTFGGTNVSCEVSPPGDTASTGCPNNCTCVNGNKNVTRGQCVEADGIYQCQCQKHWHGADCCSSGGFSAKVIAGIAGGAVAGIVLGALAAAAIIGYATKKGVDWVQIRSNNMASAQDNPMFKPQTTEHENPMHGARKLFLRSQDFINEIS